MEDQEFKRRMDEMEKKLDVVFVSSERMRKLFMWSVIAGVALFVLPLVGLFFAIPSFLASYSSIGNIGI